MSISLGIDGEVHAVSPSYRNQVCEMGTNLFQEAHLVHCKANTGSLTDSMEDSTLINQQATP